MSEHSKSQTDLLLRRQRKDSCFFSGQVQTNLFCLSVVCDYLRLLYSIQSKTFFQ